MITDNIKIVNKFNDFFADIGPNLAKNIKCMKPDDPLDYMSKPNNYLYIYIHALVAYIHALVAYIHALVAYIRALVVKLNVLLNVCRFRWLVNESNKMYN